MKAALRGLAVAALLSGVVAAFYYRPWAGVGGVARPGSVYRGAQDLTDRQGRKCRTAAGEHGTSVPAAGAVSRLPCSSKQESRW